MASSAQTSPSRTRSPSPETPETSDSLEIEIQTPNLTNPWFNTNVKPLPLSNNLGWDSTYFNAGKEEDSMLKLEELIQDGVYEDIPRQSFPTQVASQPQILQPPSHALNLSNTPNGGSTSLTKPIPPPPHHWKRDPASANQKVVFPPKETCSNLPIIIPSIPPSGTKSRVETQVRVTLDLADSVSKNPLNYNRVGTWKWLQLPQGTATKKRTRKQGRIDPETSDILHLSTSVSCATPPHNPAVSCSSCRTREAKRIARKIASRRRGSSPLDDEPIPGNKRPLEDTNSIVQFNCAEILDFSAGTVVLPLRITCYCRHHREKTGFRVHFTVSDDQGREVGSGVSGPIMITDDHKTFAKGTGPGAELNLADWAQAAAIATTSVGLPALDSAGAPSRRNHFAGKQTPRSSKKRAKPYDSTRTTTWANAEREASTASVPSPSARATPSDSRSPTPPQSLFSDGSVSGLDQARLGSPPQQQQQQFHFGPVGNGGDPPHAPDAPIGATTNSFQGMDILMPPCLEPHAASPVLPQQTVPNPMPFLLFPNSHLPAAPAPLSTPAPAIPPPTIFRLIPSKGPTLGGIEVIILGANFQPTVLLSVVFGGVHASSVQRWSDNTLVCILPPRPLPGVVAVWFELEGVNLRSPQPSGQDLFTYTDESDNALMALALQVVWLKKTGQIEDAKNVAMQIVTSVGNNSGDQNGGESSNMMKLANLSEASVPMRFVQPRLGMQQGPDLERLLIEFFDDLIIPSTSPGQTFLTIPQALAHCNATGQTVLHLATFLGFVDLVRLIVGHSVDLDVRDRNGFTPLHFAATMMAGGPQEKKEAARECAKVLLSAGADREIVDVRGKTAEELAGAAWEDLGGRVETSFSTESGGEGTDEEEEAGWGDVEDSEEDVLKSRSRRRNRTWHPNRPSESSRRPNVTSPLLPALSEEKAGSSSKDADSKMPDNKPANGHRTVDEKQTASFVDMIQKTIADQLYAAQGIIPNMPQLPQIPFPGMPNVPWGALPQIPMVFPVFVPMPGWPSFLADKRGIGGKTANEIDTSTEEVPVSPSYVRAMQEWKVNLEKWMALAAAAKPGQRQEEVLDEAPPVYTPRDPQSQSVTPVPETLEGQAAGLSATIIPGQSGLPEIPASAEGTNMVARRLGYEARTVTDREVRAFARGRGHRAGQKKRAFPTKYLWKIAYSA